MMPLQKTTLPLSCCSNATHHMLARPTTPPPTPTTCSSSRYRRPHHQQQRSNNNNNNNNTNNDTDRTVPTTGETIMTTTATHHTSPAAAAASKVISATTTNTALWLQLQEIRAENTALKSRNIVLESRNRALLTCSNRRQQSTPAEMEEGATMVDAATSDTILQALHCRQQQQIRKNLTRALYARENAISTPHTAAAAAAEYNASHKSQQRPLLEELLRRQKRLE